MKKIFIPIVLSAFLSFGLEIACAQTSSVTILQPSLGQVVGDTMVVQCSIDPGIEVDSMNVVVVGTGIYATFPLPYDPSSATFRGVVPLTGVPNETLTATVSVYLHPGVGAQPESQFETGSRITFVHNPLLQTTTGPSPLVTIQSPTAYSVARPYLHLKVNSSDMSDSCQLVLSLVNYSSPYSPTVYTILGSYWDSIETDLNLSAYQGMKLALVVEAIDKNNQTSAAAPILCFSESSTILNQVFAANGNILDCNYNQLFVVNGGLHSNPRIVNFTTGDSILIPYSGMIGQAYISPQGALFTGNNPASNLDTLYDFNNNTLYYLGTVISGTLKVAGNYCKWGSNYSGSNSVQSITFDSLYLRNITAKTNTVVTGHEAYNRIGYISTADVTQTGVVAYVDSNENVTKYYNNTYMSTTGGDPTGENGTEETNPLTDGTNIVCMKFSLMPDWLEYIDSQWVSHQLTTYIDEYVLSPGTGYQVNNGYFAYTNPTLDPSASYPHLHYPTGLDSTLLLQSATLDLLNPIGQLTFLTQSDPTTTLRQLFSGSGTSTINSSLGLPFYRDSTWYIAIGRVLFSFNANIRPDSVKNSTLHIREDSGYIFKTTDFTSNFTGSGQLAYIRITTLPVTGTLKKAGVPVNAGDTVGLASIGTLSYSPPSGFTGVDSFRWNAFDGLAYTPANALLSIDVLPPLVKPAITGLDTTYCESDGLETGKIANLPAGTASIGVLAQLDSTLLTVNPADSSFSFTVSGLAVGTHSISVTYADSAGSDSTLLTFSVTAPVTPRVTLSSSTTTATNPVTPVILTAIDTAGGGANPLYTFSLNNSFTAILQGYSGNNVLSISPDSLTTGSNWIYVRMKTSAICYTSQTAVDSIDIIKGPSTGIVDPDFPGQVIAVYPNPFDKQINITGLSNTKSYLISLYGINGQTVSTTDIENVITCTITNAGLARGIYLLRIYDETKGRTLGTVQLLKE